MIDSFRDEYFFLSNFYECPVTFGGITYQNNEAAFQAQKTLEPAMRERFAGMNPTSAKHAGRRVSLRADWEEVKADLMYQICRAKFSQHPDLAQKLLATGDEMLIEGNNWGDRTWGMVNGKGKNLLGQILMRIRNELAEKEDA